MSVYDKCKKQDDDIKKTERQMDVVYSEFKQRTDDFNNERDKQDVPPNYQLLKQLEAAKNEKWVEYVRLGEKRLEAFDKWMKCIENNISN
ncbi:MAG TPA: hypothetical protein VLX61_04270 [Anaerolineales bacterium]|nr:hypothetical protein [Anaerolineales bacterium]